MPSEDSDKPDQSPSVEQSNVQELNYENSLSDSHDAQDHGTVSDNSCEENAYVVTLPHSRHSESESMKAKMKEIEDFRIFDVYQEVDKPVDKDILGTQLVITEKEAEKGKPVVRKARLCILGNHEKNINHIATESPTVAKSSIRLLLLEAARHPEWFRVEMYM